MVWARIKNILKPRHPETGRKLENYTLYRYCKNLSLSLFLAGWLWGLAVLVFRCRNQAAPEYLARELQWAVEVQSRRRLRSASSQRLVVRRTRLRTVGDSAFSAVGPTSFMEQPACRRCRFSVAGNLQGAPENISVRTVVWPLTPTVFVSPVLEVTCLIKVKVKCAILLLEFRRGAHLPS